MALVQPAASLLTQTRPKPRRGTYFIQTWGCQMNEEDSEQMSRYLEGLGFEPVDSIFEASVILLNTCSVRKKPEDKAFSVLGELVPLKKRDPKIILAFAMWLVYIAMIYLRRIAGLRGRRAVYLSSFVFLVVLAVWAANQFSAVHRFAAP